MRSLASTSTLFLLILCLGSGCIAFNVGKPTVITDTKDISESQSAPVSIEIVSVKPQSRQTGTDRVTIGLGADVEETHEKRMHNEIWTIRKQRRLGVGLFPGAAEIYLMPEGALVPVLFQQQNSQGEYKSNPLNTGSDYVISQTIGGLLTCGIVQVLGTVNSLLVAPFDSWECSHDLIEPDYVRESSRNHGCWTASASPKLRILDKYSSKLGVHTCLDAARNSMGGVDHCGLIGLHKYVAVFVDGPEKGESIVVETETKRRNMAMNGPYIVEFSIPELNYSDWNHVTSREKQTAFRLPIAQHDCTVEAWVVFRRDDSPNVGTADGLTEKALEKALGQVFRLEVSLKGGGGEAIKMKKLYEINDIQRFGDGKYVVRVEIKDKSKTLAIGRNIENEVRRFIREDYLGKHPITPVNLIRETVMRETEDDGSVLVYTGWAFSVRPMEDGWFYDSDSRRGWVRLRITGGMPAEDAKRWARENIAAIVSEKNVEIEAGKAPPSGATFRSLGESFENSVLTIEFEAVQ